MVEWLASELLFLQSKQMPGRFDWKVSKTESLAILSGSVSWEFWILRVSSKLSIWPSSLLLFQVVRNETGNCTETMHRKSWDVQDLIGQHARVRLIDDSSDGWGHINFDDLKGDIICVTRFKDWKSFFTKRAMLRRFERKLNCFSESLSPSFQAFRIVCNISNPRDSVFHRDIQTRGLKIRRAAEHF